MIRRVNTDVSVLSSPCLVNLISTWLGTGKYGICLIHCVTKSTGNSIADTLLVQIVFSAITGNYQTSDKDKIDNVEMCRPLYSNFEEIITAAMYLIK